MLCVESCSFHFVNRKDKTSLNRMHEKCCCGCCFLSTGTAMALTLSALQAMFGILWNVELLMLLNKSETVSPLHMLINVDAIEDFDVIHGLTLAAIGLNSFWLLFSIIAARGNVTLKHGKLAFWDMLTYLITFFDMGATIFIAIKLQGFFSESSDLYLDSKPAKTLTYLTLLIAFSKGGIIIFFNVYLAHIVQLRLKEIDHDHSALAMYIISHIARCKNDNAPYIPGGPPGPPPAYASSGPYYVPLPSSSCDDRSDSNGSQWSLSYDAIQGMSNDPPKHMPPPGKRISSLDFARALSRNPSCTSEAVIVNTDTSPVSPY